MAGVSCWIFTLAASIWLFFNMLRHFVHSQTAGGSCWIFTLVALMWFLPSVFQNVHSKMNSLSGWEVALCALVQFLTSVNEGVGLQITLLAEWFIALSTIILLDSIVDLLMEPKSRFTCKRLWTLVARPQIFHPCWRNVPVPLFADHYGRTQYEFTNWKWKWGSFTFNERRGFLSLIDSAYLIALRISTELLLPTEIKACVVRISNWYRCFGEVIPQ